MKIIVNVRKNNKLFYSILLILILLNFIGCAASEEELYGKYSYDNKDEREIITITNDYKYTWDIYNKKSHESHKTEGVWSYYKNGGGYYINFRPNSDTGERQPSPSKPVEKWFGTIYLGTSDSGAKTFVRNG